MWISDKARWNLGSYISRTLMEHLDGKGGRFSCLCLIPKQNNATFLWISLCACSILEKAFITFHVMNAWEEKTHVDGNDGEAPMSRSVVKIITCDHFEFSIDLVERKELMTPGKGESEALRKAYFIARAGHGLFPCVSSN